MATTFDQLVSDVLQTLQGYGLAQPRASHLTADITSSATQITVVDASGFEQGIVERADVEFGYESFLRFFARTTLRLTQPTLHRFAEPMHLSRLQAAHPGNIFQG